MASMDLQLLGQYADDRDAEAFAELVARHRDMVYATCYRVLSDPADAEDATQECFLRLATHAGSIKTCVAGWLHRVAVHTSVSVQRRNRRRQRTERKAASTLMEGPGEASWDEIKAEIDRAIDTLPDRLREPVVLHFLQGKPQMAIAEDLGTSQPSVSRRIKEGVEKLRRHLAKTGLIVSAAGLVGVLDARAAQAAPPALLAQLGKIGLAGVGSGSSGAGAGSALGLGLITGAKAKIACVAATALTALAIVQYAAQEHAVPHQATTSPQTAASQQTRMAVVKEHVIATPLLNTHERSTTSQGSAPAKTAPTEGPMSASTAPRDHRKRVAVRPTTRDLAAEPKPRSRQSEMSPVSTEPLSALVALTAPSPAVEKRPTVPPVARVAQAADGAGREAVTGQDVVAESPAVDTTARLAALAPQSLQFFFAQPRQPPGPEERQVIERPGLSLSYKEGVDQALCSAIADVVAVAKGALDGLFPERAKPEIRVIVSRGSDYSEYTATDRHDTIYVRAGRHGLGEWKRPDAGPIGLLCEAVAELHNHPRVAGFDRLIAHRHLVPAVVDEVGEEAIERMHPAPLADDGPATVEAITAPEYALLHPDFAALAALVAIEDELEFDGLRELLDGVPGGTDDPFADLREAAIERAPATAEAFTLYDESNELWLEEDGTCLVASFEPDEVAEKVMVHRIRSLADGLLVACPGLDMSRSDEWATHGTQSLKAEAFAQWRRMSVYLSDPDWKLKDWQRFSRFGLDLMVEGEAGQRVVVSVEDHVAGAHGTVVMFSEELLPGEPYHVSYPLTPASLRGEVGRNAGYFSGRLRAEEVSRLSISVEDAQQPFTLYIDNIRLTPRGAEGPGEPEEVEPEEPAPDDEANNAALRRMELQAQAAADVQAALAEKRKRNLEAAEELLRRAIERDETYVEAHRVLAWTLVELGRETEAVAEFQRVIELAADGRVRKEAEEALERLR